MISRISSVRAAAMGLAILSLCWLISPSVSYGFEIEIDISPNVLNIESEGTVVTVHTDIRYDIVDVVDSTVYLNGIEIQSCKADNRGDFVAKFSMDEVKELYEPIIDDYIDDYINFRLEGYTKSGIYFFGKQEIMVIDVTPQGG